MKEQKLFQEHFVSPDRIVDKYGNWISETVDIPPSLLHWNECVTPGHYLRFLSSVSEIFSDPDIGLNQFLPPFRLILLQDRNRVSGCRSEIWYSRAEAEPLSREIFDSQVSGQMINLLYTIGRVAQYTKSSWGQRWIPDIVDYQDNLANLGVVEGKLRIEHPWPLASLKTGLGDFVLGNSYLRRLKSALAPFHSPGLEHTLQEVARKI